MKRRRFIKKSCMACIGLAGAGLLLEGCAISLPMVKTTATNNLLNIPISKFTAQNNMVIVRGAGMENDILLIKKEGAYKALYMRCTHENIALTTTATKLVCPAHGSIFDFNGDVVKEPALRPLKQFETEINENNILIHLL